MCINVGTVPISTSPMKAKTKVPMPPKPFKALVRYWVPRYLHDLGYRGFTFDVSYMDGNKPYGNVAMEIHVDHSYQRVNLTVYPISFDEWRRLGDQHTKNQLAHEIAHIATEPMRGLIEKPFKTEQEMREKWEALTTILGRYLFAAVECKSCRKPVAEGARIKAPARRPKGRP